MAQVVQENLKAVGLTCNL